MGPQTTACQAASYGLSHNTIYPQIQPAKVFFVRLNIYIRRVDLLYPPDTVSKTDQLADAC